MEAGDSLHELNKALALYQTSLKLSELKLNSTMELLSKNVDKKDLKRVQKAKMMLNLIIKKTKDRQNVDKEIKAISKEFKQEIEIATKEKNKNK